MSEEIKINLWVNTGYSGASHRSEEYVEKEYWDNLTPTQREDFLDELAKEYLSNCIDYGAYVEDEE